MREPIPAYGNKVSIEECLEMENHSSEKHGYYGGEIFARSGVKLPLLIGPLGSIIQLAKACWQIHQWKVLSVWESQ